MGPRGDLPLLPAGGGLHLLLWSAAGTGAHRHCAGQEVLCSRSPPSRSHLPCGDLFTLPPPRSLLRCRPCCQGHPSCYRGYHIWLHPSPGHSWDFVLGGCYSNSLPGEAEASAGAAARSATGPVLAAECLVASPAAPGLGQPALVVEATLQSRHG